MIDNSPESVPVVAYHLDGTPYKEFKSMFACGAWFGVDESTVWAATCRKRERTKSGKPIGTIVHRTTKVRYIVRRKA